MRKVIVFKHVAHEVLGTLNPQLKKRGFRIRYVNFDRDPDARPTLDRYDGLIILGGYMGVYEADQYPHIKVEMQLIEEALRKNIPILGICLGAQLLAHALGADVRKNHEKEIGWYDISMTEAGKQDPLFGHFRAKEKIFQLHGDTFDIPKSAKHLAYSELCLGQAFSYGQNAYGIQFHLEVDQAMIDRWLELPENIEEMKNSGGKISEEKMREDSLKYLQHSIQLSKGMFQKFLDLFGVEDPATKGFRHGKPE